MRATLAFVLLAVGVPLGVGELFPFSVAPMFADAPKQYCRYTVVGPDGQAVPLEAVGLHRTYWGNPPIGMGYFPPPSVDEFGAVCPPDRVRCQVRCRLAALGLPWVDVTQEVVGDADGARVGVVRTAVWRVSR